MAWNLAATVVIADQGLALVAQAQVGTLGQRPVFDGLTLIWQTVLPAQPLSDGMWLAWLLLSGLVALALMRLIRRQGPSLVGIQVISLGLLLGGTVSRFIDLAHWRHAVVYLWLQVPAIGFDAQTSLATVAQWVGLFGLGLYLMRRRARTNQLR